MPVNDRSEGEQRLIRFLLGLSAPEERQAIERQCLDEPAFVERLEAIESELIEDYLEGGLPPPEHQSFEQQYLRHPERRRKVELAAALSRRFHRRRFPTFYTISGFALTTLFLVVLTASAVYYALRPSPAFLLRPGGLARSLQQTEQVISPSKTASAVPLRLDLTGLGVGAVIGRAELRTVEEETPIWSERIPPRTDQQPFLDLVIQNAVLDDRDYILSLEAGNSTVLSYSFRVHKK